jgi:hypothetical protein
MALLEILGLREEMDIQQIREQQDLLDQLVYKDLQVQLDLKGSPRIQVLLEK